MTRLFMNDVIKLTIISTLGTYLRKHSTNNYLTCQPCHPIIKKNQLVCRQKRICIYFQGLEATIWKVLHEPWTVHEDEGRIDCQSRVGRSGASRWREMRRTKIPATPPPSPSKLSKWGIFPQKLWNSVVK